LISGALSKGDRQIDGKAGSVWEYGKMRRKQLWRDGRGKIEIEGKEKGREMDNEEGEGGKEKMQYYGIDSDDDLENEILSNETHNTNTPNNTSKTKIKQNKAIALPFLYLRKSSRSSPSENWGSFVSSLVVTRTVRVRSGSACITTFLRTFRKNIPWRIG
jgi:hypothetical protein